MLAYLSPSALSYETVSNGPVPTHWAMVACPNHMPIASAVSESGGNRATNHVLVALTSRRAAWGRRLALSLTGRAKPLRDRRGMTEITAAMNHFEVGEAPRRALRLWRERQPKQEVL